MPRHNPHHRRGDQHTPSTPGSSDSELVYGRRPVFEVIQAGKRSLHRLWIGEGVAGGVVEDIVKAAREQGAAIDRVPNGRLDQMVRGNHQGLVAQVSATQFVEMDEFLRKKQDQKNIFLVALDEIQDPQNVGSILRSAGFFGVDGVIVPRWRNAPIGDAAFRASAGAIEHLTMIRVKNLAETVLELKEKNFHIMGADMNGQSVWDVPVWNRQVLVMGNEGDGIRHLVRERCDTIVSIAGSGKVNSLNVGSAAAILMAHLSRKTGGKRG